MKTVGIEGIGVAFGEIHEPVEAVAADGRLTTPVDALRRAGFSKHYRAGAAQSALTLAVDACQDLKQELGGDLGAIDLIICVSTFAANETSGGWQNDGTKAPVLGRWDMRADMNYLGSALQAALGLDQVPLMGMGQMGCTGILGAMRVGQAMMIADNSINRVLVVTSDRFRPEASYEQSYTLISDGAGAVLLSRDASSLRLTQFHALRNAQMLDGSPEEQVGCFFNYHQKLITELLDKAEKEISDLRWIVPQNTNRGAWDIMAKVLKVDTGQVVMESMAEVGHVIGSDVLITLRGLVRSKRASSGDQIILCTVGHGMTWQACLLTY